jgi:hypothetical protein
MAPLNERRWTQFRAMLFDPVLLRRRYLKALC